jgi:hypothetical protein
VVFWKKLVQEINQQIFIRFTSKKFFETKVGERIDVFVFCFKNHHHIFFTQSSVIDLLKLKSNEKKNVAAHDICRALCHFKLDAEIKLKETSSQLQ